MYCKKAQDKPQTTVIFKKKKEKEQIAEENIEYEKKINCEKWMDQQQNNKLWESLCPAAIDETVFMRKATT